MSKSTGLLKSTVQTVQVSYGLRPSCSDVFGSCDSCRQPAGLGFVKILHHQDLV